MSTGALPAAVLFDMDGTLIAGEHLWAIAHRRVACVLGGTLSASTEAALVGADVETSVSLLLADVGRGDAAPHVVADTRGLLLSTVSALYDAGVDWMPGAREALRLVTSAGLPTALVTNTPRAITERVLDVIGRESFEAVVCADDVAAGKPAPGPYRCAAEWLGVPIGECVAVEDSPDGALSAERAGAVVIVVPDRAEVPPGPRRIFLPSLVGLTLDDLSDALGLAEPSFADAMSRVGGLDLRFPLALQRRRR